MRATKAPPRGPITADVAAGEKLFASTGCAVCHTPSITTARPGTVTNGGALTVPVALGNKVIHPYSDSLLHDIGASDGLRSCRTRRSPARPTRCARRRCGR